MGKDIEKKAVIAELLSSGALIHEMKREEVRPWLDRLGYKPMTLQSREVPSRDLAHSIYHFLTTKLTKEEEARVKAWANLVDLKVLFRQTPILWNEILLKIFNTVSKTEIAKSPYQKDARKIPCSG